MGRFVVRPAGTEDDAAVEEVSRSAYRTVRDVYRPMPSASTSRQAAQPEYATLVGEVDGAIVAVVEYRIDVDSVHLRGLGVVPTRRRHGFARRMISELDRLARAEERSRLTLYTIRETGNVAVFERLGFTVAGEEIARWCESDRYECLHDVRMTRAVE